MAFFVAGKFAVDRRIRASLQRVRADLAALTAAVASRLSPDIRGLSIDAAETRASSVRAALPGSTRPESSIRDLPLLRGKRREQNGPHRSGR